MKTIRILPAALAVALFAAGGVTHAFADTGQRFHRDFGEGLNLQMGRSIEPGQAMTTAAVPKGDLTWNQAERKAEDTVGGGKVVASVRYGLRDDLYKFDIKKGDITKRVFVDGRTGKARIAASLAPDIDPSIVGDPYVDNDQHNT